MLASPFVISMLVGIVFILGALLISLFLCFKRKLAMRDKREAELNLQLNFKRDCERAFDKLEQSRANEPPPAGAEVDADSCGFWFVDASWLRELAMRREAEKAAEDDSSFKEDSKKPSAWQADEIEPLPPFQVLRGSRLVHHEEAKPGIYEGGSYDKGWSEGKFSPDGKTPGGKTRWRRRHKLWYLQLSKDSCLKHLYKGRILVVSHRWQYPHLPDPGGEQLRVIQEYLLSHTEIKYVWFDHWSMPQDMRTEEQLKDETTSDTRTPEELAEFNRMLKSVNVLYLGCRVLILLDKGYLGRFWTCFEAWIAFRKATPEGLVEAHGDSKHYAVEVLSYACDGDEITAKLFTASLLAIWQHCSWEEALSKLRSPDITVTNDSDKEDQLRHLEALNEYVRTAMAYNDKGLWFSLGSFSDLGPAARPSDGEAATVASNGEAASWSWLRRLVGFMGGSSPRQTRTDGEANSWSRWRLRGLVAFVRHPRQNRVAAAESMNSS